MIFSMADVDIVLDEEIDDESDFFFFPTIEESKQFIIS